MIVKYVLLEKSIGVGETDEIGDGGEADRSIFWGAGGCWAPKAQAKSSSSAVIHLPQGM